MRRTVRRVSSSQSSLEWINHLVQILAIIGAGAWGGYTFIYQDQIKPLAGAPQLQVETNLSKLGTKGDTIAVQLSIKLQNTGAMTVRVMALAYNLVGYRIAEKKSSSVVNAATTLKNLTSSGYSYEEKYYEHQDKTILAQNVFLLNGAAEYTNGTIFILPDSSFSLNRIIYVDRKKFDGVELESRYLYTKNEENDFPVLVKEQDKTGLVTVNPKANHCTSFESPNCLIGTSAEDDLSLW